MLFFKSVDIRLQWYILRNIVPQYKELDAAHNEKHIYYVMKRSVAMAKAWDVDVNMAYCIAAFHDIGMLVGRQKHEIYGAAKLENDKMMIRFFDSHDRYLMKSAIEEHRASYVGAYTSIYSKIISQADRSFDIYLMTERSIQYGIKYFPRYTYDEHYRRTYDYLKKKYGEGGYAHLLLEYLPDQIKWDGIRKNLNDESQFRKIFNKCYHDEVMVGEHVDGDRVN